MNLDIKKRLYKLILDTDAIVSLYETSGVEQALLDRTHRDLCEAILNCPLDVDEDLSKLLERVDEALVKLFNIASHKVAGKLIRGDTIYYYKLNDAGIVSCTVVGRVN